MLGNLRHGLDWGPKGAIELWLNLSPDAFASLNADYTTAHDTISVHSRLGYRILPSVSAGLEATLNGNFKGSDLDNHDYRGGLFLRYEWFTGEISVSGGMSSNDLGNISGESFYGTVNWATHF